MHAVRKIRTTHIKHSGSLIKPSVYAIYEIDWGSPRSLYLIFPWRLGYQKLGLNIPYFEPVNLYTVYVPSVIPYLQYEVFGEAFFNISLFVLNQITDVRLLNGTTVDHSRQLNVYAFFRPRELLLQ